MSNGNGKVPSWLAALGIKDGEYFVDAKPRWKRAMKARCFCPAARLYAFLGLHTMGFQQELAVKMEAGKKVPATPSDAAAATGILKQHIRLYMNDLRSWGLGELKGSTKGRVEMYAWAVPRPVADSAKGKNGNSAMLPFPDAPEWLTPLLKTFKIRLPEGFVPSRGYLSEVETAARRYQEARMVLARVLKGNSAQDRPNKEERNERNIERNTPSVGRSETTRQGPTDRPDQGLTQRETQLQDWLLEKFPQIPTHLDLPLLRRLAGTITTDEEFAHFKACALAVSNPRKWIVFERAWNRDRKRPKFKTAAAGEDPLVARVRAQLERSK